MEQISNVLTLIGGIVSTVLLPLLGVFLFYGQKKRKEEAETKKAEAAAKKSETDNITAYAAEWKKNYEEEKATVSRLNDKIDQLYVEKENDRTRIRELMEKNTKLELEKLKLEVTKCLKRGCKDREPPSDY